MPIACLIILKMAVEGCFAAHLKRMQPDPGYARLFKAIVLDVWKEKQAQSLTLGISLRKRVADLVERKERLEEAFLYERTIDRETFERQRDKLNEQILLAEMHERDAALEGYDIEGVLAFAEHILLNASRLWTEFSSDQKQRLQKVLFPEGATFTDGEFRTAVMCPLFKLLDKPQAEKSSLATLTGFEPAFKHS